MPESRMTFAVDTGGTFTDLIIDTGTDLKLFKTHTTPDDPVVGVLDVLDVAAEAMGLSRKDLLGAGDLFMFGTTRAINALVTSSTARTAFLTTAGHPDILLFREGGRADPFDFSVAYPEPLIPRALTFEVPGRVTSTGTVVTELDEDAVLRVIDRLKDEKVEAVGVALLWSIVNPDHERRVGALLDAHLPLVPYTLSHELNPTLREYRRASSTCIDASLKPLMTSFFSSLGERLAASGFGGRLLILTSQGGMLDASDIARAPIHSINSGPSMAPVAGRFYAGRETGQATAIVTDAGGTTYDVSLVREGRIPRTRETWIGPEHQGHITGFPSVDVTSVGAGGGSIAWVDEAGLLHVGPRSAGSHPGPACYGLGGTEPTLTDACLILRYLDPAFFLGGAMALDETAAAQAVRRGVAEPLGLDLEEAAAAVVRITTENMVHAIEELTVNQGIDPRQAVLVGGGGAAGLNAVALARRLGTPTVLIPETGAALSAMGALLSDLSNDHAITRVTTTDDFDLEGVNAVLDDLRRFCERFVEGAAPGAPFDIEYSFEGHYPRQNWDLEIPFERVPFKTEGDVRALVEQFHRTHAEVFAINEPDSHVEIVTWRARVRAQVQDSTGRRVTPGEDTRELAAGRRIYLEPGGWTDVPIIDLEGLRDGSEFAGPAIVESTFTTVVVDASARARKSDHGTLVIDLEASA